VPPVVPPVDVVPPVAGVSVGELQRSASMERVAVAVTS
jgi:hypothetical protein